MHPADRAPGGDRNGARRRLLVAAALAALVLAAFLPALGDGFVSYDDPTYVTANPHVLSGITGANLRWALTTFHAANWHPLTWVSHQLDAQLHGPDPRWHHATSIALHLAAAIALFLALEAMTGAPWAAAAAAALFAVHPLRVESVAWVAQRKDVLAGLLWWLSLLAYARYARTLRPGAYLAALGSFALALLSKPVAVSLPLVLLLLDWWPLGRWRPGAPGPRQLLLEKAPFLALAAGASVLTVRAQSAGGALIGLGQLPFGERAANATVSVAAYLGKLLWPARLAIFYPPPEGGHAPAAVAAAAALLLGAAALALRFARTRPYLAAGGLWYGVVLLPMSGLVQVGAQAMADRYTYLPTAGVLVAAVWAGREARRGAGPVLRSAGGAALACVLAAFVVLARRQAGFWRDDTALFEHALAVTTGNWVAHNNLGMTLAARGRSAEAIGHYRAALRREPRYGDAHYNLGVELTRTGEPREAESQFREAIGLQPADASARYNLGLLLAQQGRLEEAVAQLREAARLRPEDRSTAYNLALALDLKGDRAGAAAVLRDLVRAQPDYARARELLGRIEGRAR